MNRHHARFDPRSPLGIVAILALALHLANIWLLAWLGAHPPIPYHGFHIPPIQLIAALATQLLAPLLGAAVGVAALWWAIRSWHLAWAAALTALLALGPGVLAYWLGWVVGDISIYAVAAAPPWIASAAGYTLLLLVALAYASTAGRAVPRWPVDPPLAD